MTALAVEASRPVVGSSRKRKDGDTSSSIPMLVRFRSPPETPRMICVPTCTEQKIDNQTFRLMNFGMQSCCTWGHRFVVFVQVLSFHDMVYRTKFNEQHKLGTGGCLSGFNACRNITSNTFSTRPFSECRSSLTSKLLEMLSIINGAPKRDSNADASSAHFTFAKSHK